MDQIEVGHLWDKNAEAWTALARQGYDLHRDLINTPAFLEILPPIQGLRGLDLGCGEGSNTRILAELGAKMVGIDISEVFIRYAQEKEASKPLGIEYQVANAVELPLGNETFDFATAFMSLMDIPNNEKAIDQVFRILKPGGFFQFSILHPCFLTPHRRSVRDAEGKTYAVEVGDYFNQSTERVEEWIFSNAPPELKQQYPKFQTAYFQHTLSEWLNLLIHTGLIIKQLAEPKASDAAISQYPKLQDTHIVPDFLIIQCQKPYYEL